MTRKSSCDCGAALPTTKPFRSRCARCHAAYMRDWRKSGPKTTRSVPGQLIRAKEKLQHAATRAAAQAKARSAQKLHIAAGAAARQSKHRGTLISQPCVVCGGVKAQMHHVDYDRPLDVVWLCERDHKAWHRFWRALVVGEFERWVAKQQQESRCAA